MPSTTKAGPRRLAAACAVLALAGTASSARADTTAPAPTVLTAPAAMPLGFNDVAGLYARRSLTMVPAGATVLTYNVELIAGDTTDVPITCPDGTAIGDLNLANPPGDTGVSAVSLVALYGKRSATQAFPTTTPGTLQFFVLCMPHATATSTLLPPYSKAPVAFRSPEFSLAYAKGATLPRGSRVIVHKVTGASPDGTIVSDTASCPDPDISAGSVVSSLGRGGSSGVDNSFSLFPSPALSPTKHVTVWELCIPPTVF